MFYLASKLVSVSFGFLYPTYSSYKAIRANDAQATETWLMYWAVMAGLHAFESTLEWAVNWFPFYYEAKSIVIVWLTLPQIQGSTFVYVKYIHPFLQSHEEEIDKSVSQAKDKAKAAGLDYIRRGWAAIRETVMKAILSPEEGTAAAAASMQEETPAVSQPAMAPPTLRDPLSSPAQQAWSFAGSMLRSYGPSAIAATQAVLRPLGHTDPSSRAANLRSGQSINSQDARRKKYDDLAAGQDGRLYAQEVPRPASTVDRRVVSAAAALVGATGGNASASMYSDHASMTRQQLRKRRLELEQELALLKTPDTVPRARSPGDTSSLDSGTGNSFPGSPANSRDRHVSAPTPPRTRGSSNSLAGQGLDASAYETIGADDPDFAQLPHDWGKAANKDGWKGAPPAVRPAHQKRASWFWNSSQAATGPSSDRRD